MKGLSHFMSALAAATFIPGVVELAARDQSAILLLAGFFGVLPDWLDFKLARFFEPADEDLTPAAPDFNAQALANQLAAAIRRAHTRESGWWVQFHAAQFGSDRWRRYSIQFDSANGAVIIRPGPIINSGGFALAEVGAPGPEGRAEVGVPMQYVYDGEMTVETMEGPCFEFLRVGPAVEVSFLPWHRRWSHSLVLAAMFGVAVGWLWGATAGWVVTVAFATHILEDQLGYLGSNLWWPFTARRSSGLGWMHSGDALPNFVTVFVSCGLILFNLNRFSGLGLYDSNTFLLWAVALPATLGLGLYWLSQRPPQPLEGERQFEILTELNETEVE
jgi:hypothetical protein